MSQAAVGSKILVVCPTVADWDTDLCRTVTSSLRSCGLSPVIVGSKEEKSGDFPCVVLVGSDYEVSGDKG